MKSGYAKFFCVLVALMSVMLFSSGCTRKVDSDLTLKLTVPSGSSFSSMTLPSAKLATIIINVRVPGKNLFVKEVDYHDSASSPAMTDAISLEVPNVPNGSNALVQYLGVFESDSGQMLFTYGDATVNINGNTTAAITATQFGSSTKQGRIAGRYITGGTSIPTLTGPTGPLIGYIMPPGGKPRMAVKKTSIVNGWFNIFVLEGGTALMTYEMMDGTKLFENKNLNYFVNPSNTYHKKLVMQKPTTYRKDHSGSGLYKAEGAEDYVLGYFVKEDAAVWTNVGTAVSSLGICYPDLLETIPNLFTSATGGAQVTYYPAAGTPNANTITRMLSVSGATPSTSADMFVTSCNPDVTLRFLHNQLSNGGHEDVVGMRPPFMMINEWDMHGGYLKQVFNGSSTINLMWKYLPGVNTAEISGATVYAKYSNNSSGSNNGNDRNCFEEATSEQMIPITELSSTTSMYAATGSIDSQTINSSNYYGFKFLICPYRGVGANREYYAGVRTGCAGDCSMGYAHFGWSASGTMTVMSSQAYPMDVMARISSFSPGSAQGHDYMNISLGSSAAGIVEGDEIMIRVAGMDGTNSCGAGIGVTSVDFTRVLSRPSSNMMVVPRGGMLEKVSTSNLPLAVGAANYCHIQVAKVMHYQDLILNSGTMYFTNQQGQLDSSNPGGVLPIRVSGTLTLNDNAWFNADGKGFPGGAPGAGYSAQAGGGGYEGSSPTAAGGGAGSFAMGGSSNATSNPNGGMPVGGGGMYSWFNMLMGSGGGGYSGAQGGTGGGMVFIAARNLNNLSAFSSEAKITVNGGAGNIFSGSYASGGGGAGSVVLMTEKIMTSNPLKIHALGGAGPTNSSSQAGGGGGGAISVVACDGNADHAHFLLNTAGGSGASGPRNGANGYSNDPQFFPSANNFSICN